MNYRNHNIMLSEESARNFYHDMTHIDHDNQARINAFMAEINSNISLHEDEDTIAATVKNINLDKIAQILRRKASGLNSARSISQTITINIGKDMIYNTMNDVLSRTNEQDILGTRARQTSYNVHIKSGYSEFQGSLSYEFHQSVLAKSA